MVIQKYLRSENSKEDKNNYWVEEDKNTENDNDMEKIIIEEIEKLTEIRDSESETRETKESKLKSTIGIKNLNQR